MTYQVDDATILKALTVVPIADVMSDLHTVAEHDRFQASWGIQRAAEVVAEAAGRIGLDDIEIAQYEANGKPAWWSFEAPVSWTPTGGRLSVTSDGTQGFSADHLKDPLTVATYSAETGVDGIEVPLVDFESAKQKSDLSGAIVLVDKPHFMSQDPLTILANAGARGFVTDATCRSSASSVEYPGRVELAPGTTLTGFNIRHRDMAMLRTWSARGATANALVRVDRTARMPVVSALLPGTDPDAAEIWIVAHLCHPRPGANDNASGVAAALGVAASHLALRAEDTSWIARRPIRFVWGPEFLGTAASLHQRLQSRSCVHAVIDLDMVGEDQDVCESPFVVEREPDTRPSVLAPLAELLLDHVFRLTSEHGGTWQTSAFHGFSDHALFAAGPAASAAILLSHPADRFNHSAADTTDRVSAIEMRRAIAVATMLSKIVGDDGNTTSRRILTHAKQAWRDRQLRRADQVAENARGSASDWASDYLNYINGRDANDASTGRRGSTWTANWDGPLNLRALLSDVEPQLRAQIQQLIRSDKRNYAAMFNMAIRADGRTSADDIIRRTSFGLECPLSDQVTAVLAAGLLDSAWVIEG